MPIVEAGTAYDGSVWVTAGSSAALVGSMVGMTALSAWFLGKRLQELDSDPEYVRALQESQKRTRIKLEKPTVPAAATKPDTPDSTN